MLLVWDSTIPLSCVFVKSVFLFAVYMLDSLVHHIFWDLNSINISDMLICLVHLTSTDSADGLVWTRYLPSEHRRSLDGPSHGWKRSTFRCPKHRFFSASNDVKLSSRDSCRELHMAVVKQMCHRVIRHHFTTTAATATTIITTTNFHYCHSIFVKEKVKGVQKPLTIVVSVWG